MQGRALLLARRSWSICRTTRADYATTNRAEPTPNNQTYYATPNRGVITQNEIKIPILHAADAREVGEYKSVTFLYAK